MRSFTLRIGVHHLGNVVDELDDLLGRPVSRRGFAGKNITALHLRLHAIFHHAQVFMDHAHHVQELALVFMNALHVDIKHRLRINGHRRGVKNFARQFFFVVTLDLRGIRRGKRDRPRFFQSRARAPGR